MQCIVVFNYLNDIVYLKFNKKFSEHIVAFARSQGLMSGYQEDISSVQTNRDIIMQMFSPIITSQRVMHTHFNNPYKTVQCQSGLNLIFEEYMGYLFVNIGLNDVDGMKYALNVYIGLARHLCNGDVTRLRDQQVASLFSRLIDTWLWMTENDQATLVEAVEQLMVNSDLTTATLKALQEAADKLRQTEFPKVHCVIFVQNKLLSLYSSRNAQEISASDIIFLTLLCESVNNQRSSNDGSTVGNLEDSRDEKEDCFELLLMGNDNTPKCIPYVVHINPLTEGVYLLIMIEVANTTLSSGLYETFCCITTAQTVNMQRDNEALRPLVDSLDAAVKKTFDGIKKLKTNLLEPYHRQLVEKWDFIKKKYNEFMKTGDEDCVIRIESNFLRFIDVLKELLQVSCFNRDVRDKSQDLVKDVSAMVNEKLVTFSEFLRIKALRNFSIGSDSLTINKYLEEFPGLVHFIYIDRTSHRITAPSLDFTSEETSSLTKNKIWSMIKFARDHLHEGYLSFMWKDNTFNYAYFLWFEDSTGSPIKPKVQPINASKAFQPGILLNDFYKKLVECAFPKVPAHKIRCYEIYCVHLGLMTSSYVLEHCRRLAATIWEVTGVPNNPIDLL